MRPYPTMAGCVARWRAASWCGVTRPAAPQQGMTNSAMISAAERATSIDPKTAWKACRSVDARQHCGASANKFSATTEAWTTCWRHVTDLTEDRRAQYPLAASLRNCRHTMCNRTRVSGDSTFAPDVTTRSLKRIFRGRALHTRDGGACTYRKMRGNDHGCARKLW